MNKTESKTGVRKGKGPGRTPRSIPGPVLLLTIGAFFISFSGVMVKTSHVEPIVSAFYRVLFGGLCLLPACIIKKDFKARGVKNNLFAVLCGLLFAADLWCWHLSIHYIGPGLATILSNFQVFVLSFVGIVFLKERLTLRFVVSVLMAFVGLFLIINLDIGQTGDRYKWGVILGFATALFYSLFLLLLRKLQSDRRHTSLFYYQMVLSLVSAVFLAGVILATGKSFAIPDGQSWVSLISLGCINQGFAWVLITTSLPRVRASHAGLILLLQPALSFFWDVLFFNRQTGSIGWLGVGVVLLAHYFGMVSKNKE